MTQETEQFWAGQFGNEYLERNQVVWQKRIPFFRKIIQLAMPEGVLEVGCNAGWNLRAIAKADPNIELAGCDINEIAVDLAMDALPQADIELCPATEIEGRFSFGEVGFDLVMTAGVLIHIPPADLKDVMEAIVATANEYILAVEYNNPAEEEINYRGHEGKLWKRPYGELYGEMGLQLIYTCPLGPDDGFGEGCTAWLLKKV